MRILGPNCLGAFNANSGLMGTFSSNIIDRTPEPGSVGIVSQSGAFGAHLYSLCDARGIGISYWVTTGNEADITIAECIGFMAAEPTVNTIMVYAEGINDPAGLAAALDLARANSCQALEFGIPADNIWMAGRCTRCEESSFFSFRRDGNGGGRQGAFIRMPQTE